MRVRPYAPALAKRPRVSRAFPSGAFSPLDFRCVPDARPLPDLDFAISSPHFAAYLFGVSSRSSAKQSVDPGEVRFFHHGNVLCVRRWASAPLGAPGRAPTCRVSPALFPLSVMVLHFTSKSVVHSKWMLTSHVSVGSRPRRSGSVWFGFCHCSIPLAPFVEKSVFSPKTAFALLSKISEQRWAYL